MSALSMIARLRSLLRKETSAGKLRNGRSLPAVAPNAVRSAGGRNVRAPMERLVGNAHPRIIYSVKTREDQYHRDEPNLRSLLRKETPVGKPQSVRLARRSSERSEERRWGM